MVTPYISLADANTYLADNLFKAAWDDADNPTRETALRHATRIIDSCRYKYSSVSTTHAFPLVGQTDVPNEVKEACVDIAIVLLEGVNPEELIEGLEIIKHKVGPIEMTKDPKAVAVLQHRYLGIPSFRAAQKLAPYLLLELPSSVMKVRI